MDSFIAIDYGSKLAGTTVICQLVENQLNLVQSKKKQDADQFIIDYCTTHQIKQVFIDAPLSLPKAYFGKGEDFFYRSGDKMLKAMSPMFLGGLTARAMKLKHNLENTQFYEVYPGAAIRNQPSLSLHYHKKKAPTTDLMHALQTVVPYSFEIDNLHQFDAIVAWNIAYRYREGKAMTAGEKSEGIIYY